MLKEDVLVICISPIYALRVQLYTPAKRIFALYKVYHGLDAFFKAMPVKLTLEIDKQDRLV
jgi:hypothetical protein